MSGSRTIIAMLRGGWRNGLSLLFPPLCRCCKTRLDRDRASGLCDSCIAALHFVTEPWCRICGVELNGGPGGQQLCSSCLQKPPPFSIARSIVHYTPEILHLLKSLKYHRSGVSLQTLQWIATRHDLTPFYECDLFIPVPLHLSRLRKRGQNQSLLLLQVMFPTRNHDILPGVLRKKRNTPPQTALDGASRRKNLRNSYEIACPEAIAGAVVCLVDDVFTTGTTAVECSRELLRRGCREVRVLTLARARGARR